MDEKFFAVYGCDCNTYGNKCGPETSIRIATLIENLKTYGDTRNYVFLGAGNVRKGYRMDFSQIMKVHITILCRNKHIAIPEIILPEHKAWGSLPESIQIRNSARKRDAKRLTVISSRYHLFRLRIIWFLIGRKMKVSFIPAPARMKLIDCSEPIKIAWALIFFLLMKMRLVRSYV